MKRWLGLALALALSGCVVEHVEVERFACTSHAQCLEGQFCNGSYCETGARPDGAVSGEVDGDVDQGAPDRGPMPDAVVIPPDQGGPDEMGAVVDMGAVDAAPVDMAPPVDMAEPDAEPPPLCGVDVAPECCQDGEIVAGEPCKATRVRCEARAGIYGADCMPRKWVFALAGTCDALGACVAHAPEDVLARSLEWCPARHMCSVNAGGNDGCTPLPGNQICPYASAAFCEGLGEGMPCNVPGPNQVGAEPPEGLCHAGACVGRDDLRRDTTFEGPLTRVPEADPTPGDFTLVEDDLPRLVDNRTGLAWQTTGVAADTLAAAQAVCAGLRPLRGGAEPWRIPDFFELTALLPAADEGLMLDVFGEGEGSAPWWSASFADFDDVPHPLVLGLAGRFAGLDPLSPPGQVHCVHGPRPSRSGQGDARTLTNGSATQDRLTEIQWLVDHGVVGVDSSACNGRLQNPRAATTAEAASLIALVGEPEDLLGVDDGRCVWGSPTEGGRWRIWPHLGTVDWVPAGDPGQCRLHCVLGDLARP